MAHVVKTEHYLSSNVDTFKQYLVNDDIIPAEYTDFYLFLHILPLPHLGLSHTCLQKHTHKYISILWVRTTLSDQLFLLTALCTKTNIIKFWNILLIIFIINSNQSSFASFPAVQKNNGKIFMWKLYQKTWFAKEAWQSR